MDPALQKEINYHLIKSQKLQETAKKLFELSLFDDSASRVYYSMFHMTNAFLKLCGERPRSHKGILQRFGLKVKEDDTLELKYGKFLNQAFHARESADYGIPSFVDYEEVEKLLLIMEDFNTVFRKRINEIINLD